MMAESSSRRSGNPDALGGLYTSGPAQTVQAADLPGRLRIRDGKEVALPGTVRLRSAIRHVPEPPPLPFFTHFCCVAERWADTREDDRAPRSIAEAADATALASEWTST